MKRRTEDEVAGESVRQIFAKHSFRRLVFTFTSFIHPGSHQTGLSSAVTDLHRGAGKTTLLKIIMDTLEPWKGIRTSHRNLKVGYFVQHFVDNVFYQLNRNNCFVPDPRALTCCSST